MRLKTGDYLLVLLTAFLFSACGKEEVKEVPIRQVKAVRAIDCSEFTGRTFPGRAEAFQEVNLGFEVGGTLIDRPVDKGDEVKRKELLAKLDPRDFENELAAARAERDRAQAHRDRIAEALKFNAVAAQELTDAEAALAAAEARVKIKDKALSDSRIYSPFDGIIAATYVENYQRIKPKEKVLRILDISQIKFTIDIPENLISYIPYVKDVEVEFDAFPGRKVPAKIKEVGTEASLTTRTFPVTLVLEQAKDFRILPGMAGQAGGRGELPEGVAESGPAVPAAAVFSNGPGGESSVWVVDEKTMMIALRTVVPGEISPCGLRVKGIRVGEWVVAAGVRSLKAGQKVRFADPVKKAEDK